MNDLQKQLNDLKINLKFTANAIVEGFISGLHQSPYHGFSVEFSDHKAYSEGDPVSLIDWKLYSKTDRYYIKRFEEETNVRTYFLLDCSNSMDYSSQGVKKIDYAKLLTACLINLSLMQRDATGLSLFNDNIIASIPAKSRSTWLTECLNNLSKVKCFGETDLPGAILRICERINKRSLIVIITDCIDNTEYLQKSLNFLKFNKHHCIIFHIVDPEEMLFNFKNEADFIDMETEDILKISPWTIKKEYLNKFDLFLMKHKEILNKLNFEYSVINTQTPIERALKIFFNNRNKQ